MAIIPPIPARVNVKEFSVVAQFGFSLLLAVTGLVLRGCVAVDAIAERHTGRQEFKAVNQPIGVVKSRGENISILNSPNDINAPCSIFKFLELFRGDSFGWKGDDGYGRYLGHHRSKGCCRFGIPRVEIGSLLSNFFGWPNDDLRCRGIHFYSRRMPQNLDVYGNFENDIALSVGRVGEINSLVRFLIVVSVPGSWLGQDVRSILRSNSLLGTFDRPLSEVVRPVRLASVDAQSNDRRYFDLNSWLSDALFPSFLKVLEEAGSIVVAALLISVGLAAIDCIGPKNSGLYLATGIAFIGMGAWFASIFYGLITD